METQALISKNNEKQDIQIKSIIQVDTNFRVIGIDLIFLDTDQTFEINRCDLPLEYIEFSRKMTDYKFINNEFKYCPIENIATIQEKIIQEQERQAKEMERIIKILEEKVRSNQKV